MLLTRIHAKGLAVPVEIDDLSARLPPAPIAGAVADALSLWKAALVGPEASIALTELGWSVALPDIDLDDEAPLEPGYDLWEVDDHDLDPVLGVDIEEVHVDASVAPDPPLYGRLREHAVRDARLVTALGQESQLHVKIGLRRLRGAGAITLDLLGARIGDVAFPIAGKERPAWLPAFLAEVGRRVHRVALDEPPPLRRLLSAGLARNPERRAAWDRAAKALHEDFGLESVALALEHGAPDLVFGEASWPSRLLDRAGRDALHLVSACFLDQPDVLVVPDTLHDDVRAWLDARTEGDEAVLEQVLTP